MPALTIGGEGEGPSANAQAHEFFEKLTCPKTERVVTSWKAARLTAKSITRASNTRSNSTGWTTFSSRGEDVFAPQDVLATKSRGRGNP